MTRRTFGQRAALFVLGCALQVCGAIPALKRKAQSFAELQIGMVFTASGKTWQIADVGDYRIRPEDGRCEDVENSRCLKWNCVELEGPAVPVLWCFCMPPDSERECLDRCNFHFPGI